MRMYTLSVMLGSEVPASEPSTTERIQLRIMIRHATAKLRPHGSDAEKLYRQEAGDAIHTSAVVNFPQTKQNPAI